MTRFIADTSIWIDYFKDGLNTADADSFALALDQEQVALTDIIAHELLVGTKTEKEFDDLKNLLMVLNCFYLAPHEFPEFNKFSWKIMKTGLRGKYTDLTIAYHAHKNNLPVASFDQWFCKIAGKGIIKTISLTN